MIRTKESGGFKIYVGSTVDLKKRRSEHWYLLKRGIHTRRFQRHSKKYGVSDLVFGVIEFCPKDKVIEREQYWIDTLFLLYPKFKFNVFQITGKGNRILWKQK